MRRACAFVRPLISGFAMQSHRIAAIAFVVATSIAGNAIAHGVEEHHKENPAGRSQARETAFGRTADPGAAQRTILVEMRAYEFSPKEITVQVGEVVRFVVVNAGKQMHEMVLGTLKELEAHNEMMKKNPGMHHDEPHMAHVAPGKS